jgi:hypothetical protein
MRFLFLTLDMREVPVSPVSPVHVADPHVRLAGCGELVHASASTKPVEWGGGCILLSTSSLWATFGMSYGHVMLSRSICPIQLFSFYRMRAGASASTVE